jgi:hypothetical protein
MPRSRKFHHLFAISLLEFSEGNILTASQHSHKEQSSNKIAEKANDPSFQKIQNTATTMQESHN